MQVDLSEEFLLEQKVGLRPLLSEILPASKNLGQYSPSNPGGALECNLTGRCPFFKNLHNLFWEKIACRYPV